jgi:hypothetical protein
VANLKLHLWGPFDRWVDGNEGADALADKGHSLPPVVEPWSLPACSPSVVVLTIRAGSWTATFDARRYVRQRPSGRPKCARSRSGGRL